ncbi:MAG: NUDIX hydrolase [Acetobacter persici]|uniref:NUDIX hydrolase n=1 Tax=Acetobacter persici TaxID=1076596 RepID=UPI0039E92EBE
MIPSFSGQWPLLRLSPSCIISVTDHAPRYTADAEAEITRIWAAACLKTPALFNGCVFSANRVTRTEISGHWTEYRAVLAQMKNPALFPHLRLQPLAVIGLLETPEGFVLGRRHPSSLYQGNFWQSPPAGSIERRGDSTDVHLGEQLLAEAEEELGLPTESLSVGPPCLIARHPGTRILDIGIPMRTPLSFSAVEARWKQSANQEYDQLALVPRQTVKEWLDRPDLLPTSRALLAATCS